MTAWMAQHQSLVWWLIGISAVTFLATLIAVPLIVVRLPRDYFTRAHERTEKAHGFSPLHLLSAIARNVVGYVFVLVGVAMLILPGQGVLTILAGLGLVDFPGKHNLIRRIVSQHAVRKSLDWIRSKAGRPPLVLDT